MYNMHADGMASSSYTNAPSGYTCICGVRRMLMCWFFIFILFFFPVGFSVRCPRSPCELNVSRRPQKACNEWRRRKRTFYELCTTPAHTPYRIDCAHLYSISFGRKATKKQRQQQLHSYKTKETIQCILVFHSLCFFFFFAKTISLGHYNNYRMSGSAL